MKCLCWTVVVVSSLSVTSFSYGQQSVLSEPKPVDALPNIPTTSMTPEMWMYLHEERRADDPVTAIRRRAELKAAQREQRLASAKWYGISNSRPTASWVPLMGTYSPTWVGNGYNTSQWLPTGYPPSPSKNYVRVEVVDPRR